MSRSEACAPLATTASARLARASSARACARSFSASSARCASARERKPEATACQRSASSTASTPRDASRQRLELAERGLRGDELLARERFRLFHERRERLAPGHERLVRFAAGLRLARAPRRGLPLPCRLGLALERGAGLLVGVVLGFFLGGKRRGDGPGHGRRHRRLARLESGSGAARRRRHAGLHGDGLERIGVGQPVDRGHRERLLLEVLGEAQQRRAVLDPAERQQPGPRIGRLAHDARERLRVGDRVERRLAHAGERGALRHARQVLGLAQAEDRGSGRRLVLLVDRHVDEPACGLLAHAEVAIATGDLGQCRSLGEPLDGRAPNTRVGVLARERQHQLVIRGRQPQYRLRAHRGIGVLPLGPTAEPVDEGLEGRLRQGCLRASDYTPTPRWAS